MEGVAGVIAYGRTDCGGFALLFAAAMRANKIPARVTQGQIAAFGQPEYQSLPEVTPEELQLELHAAGEFFVEGIGWIPCETIDW